MIIGTAVKAFLNRPRDDFRTWKGFTDSELIKRKNKLPVQPPIWRKLRREQRICFLIGVAKLRFAFFLDTGIGKTLLSVALARYFRRAAIAKRFLVLVPSDLNIGEWEDQILEHSPKTSYTVLRGSSQEKWQQFRTSKSTLIITTYAGLSWMVCDLKSVKKKRKNESISKQVINEKLIKEVTSAIDGLFLDESTEVQGHASLYFRICRYVSKCVLIVFALTGTPFGRDPTPLWAQMFLVDRGETLGETLGLFRAAFFSQKINYWGGFEYTFKKTMWARLHTILANRSIRYKADKSTLPSLSLIPKYIVLPEEASVYAARAKDAIVRARGNYQEQKNAFIRMRQISSGFLGYYDDEIGVKAKYQFPVNPKLDYLCKLIQSIDSHDKIVVFHEFVFSGDLITARLKKLGIGYAAVYGKIKDVDLQKRRFRDDPNCNVFVVNTKGAYGINLQVARYFAFYERPLRVIHYTQMRRRVERQYSKHKKVFQYDLIVRGTYDQRIIDLHREGRELFKAIVDGDVNPEEL